MFNLSTFEQLRETNSYLFDQDPNIVVNLHTQNIKPKQHRTRLCSVDTNDLVVSSQNFTMKSYLHFHILTTSCIVFNWDAATMCNVPMYRMQL